MTQFIVNCSAGDGPHRLEAGGGREAVKAVLARPGHAQSYVCGLSGDEGEDRGGIIAADHLLPEFDRMEDPVCERRCPGGWRGIHAEGCPVRQEQVEAVRAKVAADVAQNGTIAHRAVARYACPVPWCQREKGRPCKEPVPRTSPGPEPYKDRAEPHGLRESVMVKAWRRAVAEFDCPVCPSRQEEPCVRVTGEFYAPAAPPELIEPHEARVLLVEAHDGMLARRAREKREAAEQA